MAGGLQILSETPQFQRRMRRPRHDFNVRHMPFTITPFLLAPVLPGETLKDGNLQSRCVTDPIKNPLIGWWLEHYVFYVPHGAMPQAQAWQDMVLTPDRDMTPNKTVAASLLNYHAGNGIDWVQECLRAILDPEKGTWFRAKDEAWNNVLIGGLPAARVQADSWLESAVADAQMPDVQVDGTTNPVDMTQLERLYLQWEALRSMQLTEATYEDFLRSYGVRLNKAEDPTRPELLRYSRAWQYPSNTVDPTTGAPSSAVSWAVRENIDKDRFFRWPGFVFGVTIARPKVYLGKQKGAGSIMLDSALSWLPAILRENAGYSLKQIANNRGPLAGNVADANGYWVDLVDLFMYGDQFVNFDLTATDAGLVALPTTAMQKRFPAQADVEALFVGTTAATRLVRQDGVVSLSIASALEDRT